MSKCSFVTFTEAAVGSVLSDRQFSNVDFEGAQSLIDLLSCDRVGFDSASRDTRSVSVKDGLVVVGKDENHSSEKNTITIDLDCVDFSKGGENGDRYALIAIQKLFRFCVKYWNHDALNNNEHLPSGSTKAIVFPYSISSGLSYRIAVELAPDRKRTKSRYPGNHLLVYKFSSTEGDGAKEEASLTAFKKAIAHAFSPDVFSDKSGESANEISSDSLHVTRLLPQELREKGQFVDPRTWPSVLSRNQIEFIRSPRNSPARIEGPAGSGKTLCMVLKAIESARSSTESHYTSLFLVPSNEMANNVLSLMDVYCTEGFHRRTEGDVLIRVGTLQDECAKFLQGEISDSEFLDSDTLESKNTQLLHLAEIVEAEKAEIDKHKSFISDELFSLIKDDECLNVAELLRHEISVVIKGRSGESLDKYLESKRPTYGLPIVSDNDRKYVFKLFKRYMDILERLGQFDVDDVVLSVTGRLDSPLWRRRRQKEGFDAIFIDEIHFFNFNELSVIHYLTKRPGEVPISYAADVSQALGDIAWDEGEVSEIMDGVGSFGKTRLNAVFRCVPEITNLAFSVTSHGASLFSNFDNPVSVFSEVVGDAGLSEEDRPTYHLVDPDISILEFGLGEAERLRSRNNFKRSDIAFVYFDRSLFDEAQRFFKKQNKSHVVLTKRGDLDVIRLAAKQNSYVLALADHVGGLEFEATLLMGVDEGRVPSKVGESGGVASKHFQQYVAHNRVYVAVTRARKVVRVVGEAARGVSPIFETALHNDYLKVIKESR